MNNYRIISDIGSGAYSTVHKAIDVSTGHIVAIKKISDQNMNIKHIINREVTFLHESINHPNIIQLYKCFSLGSFTYLVFEFMPMDLISYYKSVQQSKNRTLNDQQICYISYQLCSALRFLHQKGIMHRDIKPQNVLINPQNLTIKLIDFGFAKQISTPFHQNTNYMVTRWYRPLQIVLNLEYNQKVDVFATGALLLELYLGHQVFRSSSNIDQYFWIVNICGFPSKWHKAIEAISKMNLKIEENSPQLKDLAKDIRPIAADLISKMLKTAPEQRISISETCQHPYFSRFKVRNTFNQAKNNHQTTQIDDSDNRYQLHRVPPMTRTTRAFSTEHLNNFQNNLSSRHNTKYTDNSQLLDERSQTWQMINSGYINKKDDNCSADKMQYTMAASKKPYIKRVSSQKDNHNLNFSKQPRLMDKNLRETVEQKANVIRNRVRSLNQHGINVVSLKKLKIHRLIQNQKSRQKQKLISNHYNEYRQRQTNNPTIKLNPKKDKQREKQREKQRRLKPMFLRVKDKINDGKLYERGEQIKERPVQNTYEDSRSVFQNKRHVEKGNTEKRQPKHQIQLKIVSSAASLKLKKTPDYKEYQFKD